MAFLCFANFAEFVLFLTSVMAGMVILLGLNAVNSTPQFMFDYYKYVKKDRNAVADHPRFWKNVLTYYVIVTEVSQAVLQPINLLPFFRRFSYLFRLEVGSLVALTELLIVLLMPHTGTPESGAVVGIIMAAFVGGLGRALFENTVFALFGTCPPKIIIGSMVGLPASGSIMSIVQIILLGSMSTDFDAILRQSVIYFSIGIGVIFVSSTLLLCLFFNAYAKNFIPELCSRRTIWGNIYRPLRSGENPPRSVRADTSPQGEGASREITIRNDSGSTPQTEAIGTIVTEQKEGNTAPEENEGYTEELTSSELLQRVSLWHVIKEIYPMQISCFLNFFATMILFPGVILVVGLDDTWFKTLVIATFNFTDLTGRVVLMWTKLRISRKGVVIVSVARLVLIPLMILCGFQKIPGQTAAYIFTGILGITSGYAGTLAMMYAPTSPGLKGNGEAAMAAQACDGALMLGCSMGALIQLAVVLAF